MFELQGVILTEGSQGRIIALDAKFTAFPELLDAMMQRGREFAIYDPLYPSPSDPGASFSYRPEHGIWKMTLGNHGWTGGIYRIEPSVVHQQLAHLHARGFLHGLRIDHVAFFEHYAAQSPQDNWQMSQRLRQVHG